MYLHILQQLFILKRRNHDSRGTKFKDGEYTAEVTMEGGSGRATIDSPTDISVKDGKVTAEIKWSSSHYDYMLVDGEKFLPVNTEGNSVLRFRLQNLINR